MKNTIMKPTREDYELAAKAAGMGCNVFDLEFVYAFPLGAKLNKDGEEIGAFRWNPLHDDGDSRRLQVACGIDLIVFDRGYEVASTKAPIRSFLFEDFCDDKLLTARSAVFWLAVEIGKKL
jgi:hypothetical protein